MRYWKAGERNEWIAPRGWRRTRPNEEVGRTSSFSSALLPHVKMRKEERRLAISLARIEQQLRERYCMLHNRRLLRDRGASEQRTTSSENAYVRASRRACFLGHLHQCEDCCAPGAAARPEDSGTAIYASMSTLSAAP